MGHPAAHDCAPAATGTPVGIFLPTLEALFLSGGTSTGPREGRVARWAQGGRRSAIGWRPCLRGVTLDNGPEPHSRRTPCMQRLVECVRQYPVNVRGAYSPPSPRQYHPLDRG